jgi:hypothetical protein
MPRSTKVDLEQLVADHDADVDAAGDSYAALEDGIRQARKQGVPATEIAKRTGLPIAHVAEIIVESRRGDMPWHMRLHALATGS